MVGITEEQNSCKKGRWSYCSDAELLFRLLGTHPGECEASFCLQCSDSENISSSFW